MSAAEPDGRQLQQDIALGRQIEHLQSATCLDCPLSQAITSMIGFLMQAQSCYMVKSMPPCCDSTAEAIQLSSQCPCHDVRVAS